MPLRDHFRPPVSNRTSWEELHGMWPAGIVRHLRTVLPPGYVAGPRVHLGSLVEIDIAAYETDDAPPRRRSGPVNGAATSTLPIIAVESEPLEDYEYEVRIYDAEKERTLVAAIEIVSPANKDRPQSRNAFISKCAALLKRGVAVSVVDLVTVRHFNLYAELMAFIGHADLTVGEQPSIYAASGRWVNRGEKTFLETCARPLVVGQPLPPIPLWLAEDLTLTLDLDPSYEQACHDLWIA